MGQRHRFSSGVKFPSSPFGHFCFTPPGLLGVIPGAFNHSATIPQAAIGRDSNPRSKIRLYGKSKHPKATGLRWMFFDSEYCYLPFNLKLGASDGTRIHNLVHGKDALRPIELLTQACRAISLPTDGPEASIIRPIKLQHGKSGANDGCCPHLIQPGRLVYC